MKTTIDLPNELVRQLKLRAAHDGRKLKELTAELLRSALAAPSSTGKVPGVVVRKDRKTGLPVIQCRRTAPRGEELTPEAVAEILTQQEAEWSNVST